jgi:hypothetical protein
MFRMFQQRDAKGYAFGIMFIINIVLWAIACFGTWVCIGLAVAAYRLVGVLGAQGRGVLGHTGEGGCWGAQGKGGGTVTRTDDTLPIAGNTAAFLVCAAPPQARPWVCGGVAASMDRTTLCWHYAGWYTGKGVLRIAQPMAAGRQAQMCMTGGGWGRKLVLP